jgi:predicted amidophosphoribosyltransferase
MIDKGDGSMARRLKDGTCPNCHAELEQKDDRKVCSLCNLEIIERESK